MKKYYDALGLKKNASQKEIQFAYDKLSKELNPINNDNQEFFIEEYEKVKQAYNALNQSSILKNSESTSKTTRPNRPESSSSSNSSDSFTVTISKQKIEELKNRKLDIEEKQTYVSAGLKTLSILSMIGSGFWLIIFFVLIARYTNIAVIFIFLIFLFPFILKFIGALRMFKGKKSGYKIYMIPSIILNIIFILSILTGHQNHNLIGAIIFTFSMIIFSFIFHSYKGKLN